MFKLIVEKELREIIGSMKFAVTFGISSLLLFLTFYIGARNYQVSVEQNEAALRENLRKLDGLNEWDEVQNFRVYLPPQPVSSLVMGVSNDIGRSSDIRGVGEINARDSKYGEDPVYAVFRFLDLDFIFQIVLSLFAILFAYDAVNGEKERGTLRLTLANAVPQEHLHRRKNHGFVPGAGGAAPRPDPARRAPADRDGRPDGHRRLDAVSRSSSPRGFSTSGSSSPCRFSSRPRPRNPRRRSWSCSSSGSSR